jgi:predicted CXXCH cytochrome family protein
MSRYLLLVVVSLAIANMAPGRAVAEEVADQFDCKACHPMKIRDFKGRRANPIVAVEEFPEEPSGVQDIASTEGMCLSCHDGFVMDSREMWVGGYRGHRVGMVPSANIAAPELEGAPEFPLNDDDKVYCGSCHSAHVNEAEGAFAKVKPFMRQGAEEGHICQACHADKKEMAESGHDRGSRRAKDFEKRGTCGNCHMPHGSDRPVMWARSVGEGNMVLNTFCRDCHDDGPYPGEHPVDVVAWSQDVRQAVRSNSAAMPVYDENGRMAKMGMIGCPTCHNLHRERAEGRPEHLPGLYLRMPEIVEPLCSDCHGPESLMLYKFFHSEVSR